MRRFQEIISTLADQPLYTLHSHTQYCDGRADMAAFAAEAAKRGFAAYGFTPHSPIPIHSTCNMPQDTVEPFLAEVDRLQALYPDVRFYKGMEVDYINAQWGPSSPYFLELPLDYAIGSVHFIPGQQGEYIDIDGRYERFEQNMREHFRDDIRYVVDTFFDQSEQMVEQGGFDIIGHFDKIKHNGGLYHPGLEDEPWYVRRVNRLIDKIIDKGYAVEINTKAWAKHQQLFPAQRHWPRLMKAGVTIVVNSDAHYPELIDANRQPVIKALQYLKNKLANE